MFRPFAEQDVFTVIFGIGPAPEVVGVHAPCTEVGNVGQQLDLFTRPLPINETAKALALPCIGNAKAHPMIIKRRHRRKKNRPVMRVTTEEDTNFVDVFFCLVEFCTGTLPVSKHPFPW